MEKTLKVVVQERRNVCNGKITRRTRKSLRRHLSKAKLGRWIDGKFVPLDRKEHDDLLAMIRRNQFSQIENNEEIKVQESFLRPLGHNNWHMSMIDRRGLKRDSWHKGVPIKIRAKAYNKMVNYCQAVKTEISGFGKTLVTKDTAGKATLIEVADVMIFKQECTGGYTDISQESLLSFIYELAVAEENPADWNLWWHTHNDFGVFWSDTDDNTVERIIKAFNPTFLLATCINKKCDLIARVDSLDDKGKQRSSDNIMQAAPKRDGQYKSKCLKQVKKLVTQKVFEAAEWLGGHSRGFYSHSDVYSGHSNFDARDTQSTSRWICHVCGAQACLLLQGKYLCTTHWQMQDSVGATPPLGNFLVGLSNKQRRERGFMQDPDLPDYQPLLIDKRDAHSGSMPFFID